MPERDLPWSSARATANQPGITDCVVRRAKRPRAYQTAAILQNSGNTVNTRRFNGLIERHWGQNSGDALSEHRLARSRRSNEQNIVAACASNLQRAVRCLLAMDVT